MRNISDRDVWYKRLGMLMLVAVLIGGLTACGPTSQSTKPDESSDTERGYGGYGY